MSPHRSLSALCLTLSLATAPPVFANADKAKEEVDYVGLAALLIRDGHDDRARMALDNVDPADEDIDRTRYYTLLGLVNLRARNLEAAKQALGHAVESGTAQPVVYVYLAQAHYGLQEYAATIRSIEAAGEAASGNPGLYLMRAQSHWKLKHYPAAWQALSDGERRFPQDARFLRQQVFYLVELKLYRRATELGNEYFRRYSPSQQDYVAVANALRKSGQPEQAARFLETARIRFPDSEKVAVELAHAYLDMDHTVAAADLFRRAALRHPRYAAEAAELYRRSGDLFQALNMNAQVPDQKKKFKQRLAIYLELKDYEQAAAMDKALVRVNLLENEDLRYALAYALFEIGDYSRAEQQLSRLTRTGLFAKAAELRKTMARCKASAWRCY